jgi:alkylation response protein AidB-like acyl-CoA dehydrogenase
MSSLIETSSESAIVEAIARLSAGFETTAQEADQNGPLNSILRGNIDQIIRSGFIAANIPKEFGGLDLGATAHRMCLKLIASACGVTAFTQQQLHAGGNFVGRCGDEALKVELLPQFASGENICGVGFSHLRRIGSPPVRALKTSTGYLIDGAIPWISAWSILNSFILGATLNDGSMIYCYLPIDEYRNSLRATAPMQLSSMSASDTVQLFLDNLSLPARYVLSESDSQHMVRVDYRGISGHTEMPLGCALGSASYLRTLGKKRERTNILETATAIERKAADIEERALYWNGSRYEEPGYQENALSARIGAISLALRAAEAGIAATGGSAHLITSPAQRRFRESAFYATQAQTSEIQASLLEEFING